MVEVDLVKLLSPPVLLEPATRSRARARLDAQVAAAMVSARRRGASRRRGLRLAVIAAAVAAVATVGVIALPSADPTGPGVASAHALILPDGSVLDRTDITRYVVEGRLDALKDRLDAFGVAVEVQRHPVHPEVVGELLGWTFQPADPEAAAAEPFDMTWTVDEGDKGSLLEIQIGRPALEGETYGTQGLSVFEIHPELCDAILYDDLQQTNRNLQALGFDVEWDLLSGNPDDPGYDPSMRGVSQDPLSDSTIYGVFQGTAQTEYAPDRQKAISIELVPGDVDVSHGGPSAFATDC